jgi:hypothetical protein
MTSTTRPGRLAQKDDAVREIDPPSVEVVRDEQQAWAGSSSSAREKVILQPLCA